VTRLPLVLLGLALLIAALAPPAGAQGRQSLDMYTARMSAGKATELVRKGYDVPAIRHGARGTTVDLVLTRAQARRLRARGIWLKLMRNSRGRTVRQAAAAQAQGGYNVWRSWDEPGGIRDELYRVARRNRRLVKLRVLGHTYQGREIIALKVTRGARRKRDGARPAVLYSSTQHAREWISTEVNRRLMHWFIDKWRGRDREIRRLLGDVELWFVLVANPDGYQYTFDVERLWRKNLRDNDGDGQISTVDGVDPNRNFDEHWNYDEEGSSSIFSSLTYRGPSPASEPETQAMQGLLDRVRPKFQSNFHSYGPLILFPQGWQVGTPDADNPIYTALGGTDANPAIPGFDPGISSDELYVTNGETTDYADSNAGTVAFTPELGEGIPGSGFVFPDDEALVQQEFEKTLAFDLALARSARDPDDPVSPVGIDTKPFYLDQAEIDPENRPLAMFDFTFEESYGNPQQVRVLAKRSLGRVRVRYRINGGRVRSARTSEWRQGERYGVGNPNYYRVMRGWVRGTEPGDTVEVWFRGGGERSDSFTYRVVSDSNRRVLLLSAEDYTGASPVQDPAGPHYLSYYADALTANGIAFDVYDVDAKGRQAPDALGVLSHYDAVVWYTGDDVIPREPGWGPGNVSRVKIEELFAIREFLNEGGRVAYTGKHVGTDSTSGNAQYFDPFENLQCVGDVRPRCRPLYGSGDGVNDVLEYWFGAGLVNIGAGVDDQGNAFNVLGVDDPLSGLSWGFNGPDSAQNQDSLNSYITTSGLLPPERYPQFESWVAARYDRPGGPFDPHTGEYYVHSQIADVSYKRLTRTISVPAGGGTLSFWTSYNTEADWDYVFVEARTPGGDNWTTLPDQNGHTSQATGQSCQRANSGGWRTLHPHLDHYQTQTSDTECSPTGTTGAWHAASGNSNGWQEWRIDLSQYAGQEVEISIAYASDWATQGLGVFIDDVTLPNGETTSFETDLGGWEATGPPEGSGANFNNFVRITGAGFPEGAAVATDDTLLMGFGLEGISDAATRHAVMGRTMQYLLR
jgi:Zinc carboxypeptidase